jgi:Zn finger protein HypA/HybF involved in hydrogenase expression
MKCIICNQYFKHTVFNQSFECENCQSIVLDEIDSEMQVEVELLKHPSGKTRAVMYDDLYDDAGDSI